MTSMMVLTCLVLLCGLALISVSLEWSLPYIFIMALVWFGMWFFVIHILLKKVIIRLTTHSMNLRMVSNESQEHQVAVPGMKSSNITWDTVISLAIKITSFVGDQIVSLSSEPVADGRIIPEPAAETELSSSGSGPSSALPETATITIINHCGDAPLVAEEVRTWVHLVLENHIKTWYSDISSNSDFTKNFEFLLEDTLVLLCEHLSKLKAVNVVSEVAQIFHGHVHQCMNSSLTKTHADVRQLLVTGVQGHKELLDHFAFKNPAVERCYLKTCVSKLIALVGPKEVIACSAPRIMATDLLADAVILPLINIISNPEWIYWNIVRLCRDEEYLAKFVKSVANLESDCKPKLPESNMHMIDREQSFECTKGLSKLMTEKMHEPNQGMILQRIPGDIPKKQIFKSESFFHINKGTNNIADHNIIFTLKRSGGLRRSFSCNDLPPYSADSPLKHNQTKPDHQLSLDAEVENRTTDASTSVEWCPTPLWLSSANSEDEVAQKAEEMAQEVETGEEPVEVGEDVALFTNVCIPSTEQRTEVGTGPYTLYKIQYDGLFEESSEGNEPSQLARRTVTVLRRFREFRNLQVRLEENQHLKNAIKGFLKPSKWDTILKSSCSKQVVAQRQKFLQKYLQQLCSSEPVANSQELQQFLAYGTDASVAYTRRAPLLPIPRIDKIVMGGMKGAIGIIKATLPNTPAEGKCEVASAGHPNGSSSHRHTCPHQQNKPTTARRASEERKIEFRLRSRQHRRNSFESHLQEFLDNFDFDDLQDSSQILLHSELQDSANMKFATESSKDVSPSFSPFGPRTEGDGCEIETNAQEQEDILLHDDLTLTGDDPLAKCALSLVADLMNSSAGYDADFVHIPAYMVLVRVFLGQPINKWLESILEKLTSEKQGVHYIHTIHESIWSTDKEGITFYNRDESWKQIGKQEACLALKAFLQESAPVSLCWGKQCDEAIARLMEVFNSPSLNRLLIYRVIDCLVDRLCKADGNT